MEFEQTHLVVGNLQIRYYGIISRGRPAGRRLRRFFVGGAQRTRFRSYLGRLNLGDHPRHHRRAPVVHLVSADIAGGRLRHRRRSLPKYRLVSRELLRPRKAAQSPSGPAGWAFSAA